MKTKELSSGLLDKNGVEIYEGDIVECRDSTYEVVFDGGQFIGVSTRKKGMASLLKYTQLNYTIIGNIHTNGEKK